jgi:hypothetical protein
MPFPVDRESLEAAGYVYLKSEPCPTCNELVEVYTTPGKRELAMNPMGLLTTPAVRHAYTCGETPPAPDPIKMYGVTDKNMLACGWRDGTLEIAFRFGRYQYANVAEDVFVTLRKVPYPNNYFTKVVKNHPELYPFTKLS